MNRKLTKIRERVSNRGRLKTKNNLVYFTYEQLLRNYEEQTKVLGKYEEEKMSEDKRSNERERQRKNEEERSREKENKRKTEEKQRNKTRPLTKEKEHHYGKTGSSEDAPLNQRMKSGEKGIMEDDNSKPHHEVDEETEDCIDWRDLE